MEQFNKSCMYPKGTVLNCPRCESHILTFARDTYKNDFMCADVFSPTEGQGPWQNGDKCQCRKCQHNFFSGGHFYGEIIFPNKEVIREKGIPRDIIECGEDSKIENWDEG